MYKTLVERATGKLPFKAGEGYEKITLRWISGKWVARMDYRWYWFKSMSSDVL
jgi:hypothetical protein